MNKPPLKNPKGGLTAAGRREFGGNLKPGVKDYTKASTADKKRWISWALRFYGQKDYPPFVDEKGEPTRFALTAAAWGEPVPKNEADARAIAAKARKRQEELNRSMAQGEVFMASFSEEIIEHYGVKGMRWGVRDAQVRQARSNIRSQKDKISNEFNKGAATSDQAKKTAAINKVNQLGKQLKENKDVDLASKTTTGEKAVHLLLFGPFALATIPAHQVIRKKGTKSAADWASTVDAREMRPVRNPKPKK